MRLLTMVANLVGQAIQMHRLIGRDRDRLISETHRLAKELSDIREVRPRVALPGTARPRASQHAGIIGDSPAIRAVLDRVEAAARSNVTVLLRGETGTGKELFARAIHDASPRRKGPFIKVNCAALPESVIESELFGHERSARFPPPSKQSCCAFSRRANSNAWADRGRSRWMSASSARQTVTLRKR